MPKNTGYSLGSTAVQAHLYMMQNIIDRTERNSISCKWWAIVLAAVVMVFGSCSGPEYVPAASIPVLLISFLDAYYLARAQGYRTARDLFVREGVYRYSRETQDYTRPYTFRRVGSVWAYFRATLISPPISVFYSAVSVAIGIVYYALR